MYRHSRAAANATAGPQLLLRERGKQAFYERFEPPYGRALIGQLWVKRARPFPSVAEADPMFSSSLGPASPWSDVGADREADHAVGVAGGEDRACERQPLGGERQRD